MLGITGIVLPILPTTPFLLLTLYAYAKGSPTFKARFEQSYLYKRFLAHYIENQGMTKRAKIKLMIFVDTMLLITFITLESWFLRTLIIVLVIIKHWFFITKVKTLPPQEKTMPNNALPTKQ